MAWENGKCGPGMSLSGAIASGNGRQKIIRICQALVSIGLTALTGYLIYREVPDWRQSFRVIVQAHPGWLVAGLWFVACHLLLRAARWGVLLSPSKPGISFKNLLSMTLVKYAVNIIPPRAGEIAASVLLARKERISAATVIAASIFERILDTIAVMAVFAFYFIAYAQRFAPKSQRAGEIILSIQNYSIKGAIVVAVGLAVLALLLRRTRWAVHLPRTIRKPALRFLDGFRSLQSHGTLVQVILLSAAIWVSILMQTWCIVEAYLQPFPFPGTLLLLGLTVLGVAIPTPGGVGGYQYFMTLGLVNFFSQQLSPLDPYSQAAGIANGCYLVVTIPVIVAGLVFLNREGLSLGRASRLKEQLQENAG